MKAKVFVFFLALIALAALVQRAGAHEIIYTSFLSGPNESPANGSPGTGAVTITLDFDLFTMRVEVDFGNLQGTATAANIHAATAVPFFGTAGIATQTPGFEDFPATTNGSYDHTIDLTQASAYNPAFVAANGGTISTASNALFAALAEGKAYFDLHTSAFPEGEVRGFLRRPPPAITSVALTAGEPTISFTTVDESSYRVEWKNELSAAAWTTVTDAGNVIGTGDVVTVSDPDPSAPNAPRRFYRVVLYFP